jgi:hypothetical protein
LPRKTLFKTAFSILLSTVLYKKSASNLYGMCAERYQKRSDEIYPSAAARRSSISSAANPRSSFVAHRHVLTIEAPPAACAFTRAPKSALRAMSTNAHSLITANHYYFHSTSRTFHAG